MTRASVRTLMAGMVLLGTMGYPASGVAQFRAAPKAPAYALENVTVVHADGRREPGVNIVVRGGLIAVLGVGAAIPGDATKLKGDSLFVYPGLIDAMGEAEVGFPEIERGDSVRSWNGPRDLQGLLAHRRVADYLTQTGADGQAQRGSGIVAAGIHPSGALAAGLGAAIVHRTDVDRPWQLIANDNLGLSMAFQGGRGVYPGTLFAVIAFMRQAFEDARLDALKRDAYASDPTGLSLPAFDPDYAVLRQAMAGEIPVYFAADRAEDIRRVLGLADEYGFRPTLVGGHEAWKLADELAARGVAVLIDGDFPVPTKWKKPEKEEPDSAAADSAAAEAAEPAEPEELEPDAAREKKQIEDIWANAARLEAAGVTFAITTGGGEADLREAVRQSMEYGLSEATALRAVTTVPAAMLGIPNVPRVGQGMAATFVAVSGPLFDEDTEVRYTFVEGAYEKGSGGGGGGAAPAVVVTGNWTITLSAMGQEFPMDATLTMEPDGSFSGSATNDQMGTSSIRGRVSGNDINFTISLNAGGQQIEITADGTVEGERMSGSGESPFGSLTFTGRKNPGGTR